jgi:hypothetical protein
MIVGVTAFFKDVLMTNSMAGSPSALTGKKLQRSFL